MARILLALVFGVCLVSADQEEVEGGKCEKIKLPLCQDWVYNWTAMPNLMGHNDQNEAEEVVSYILFYNITIINFVRVKHNRTTDKIEKKRRLL